MADLFTSISLAFFLQHPALLARDICHLLGDECVNIATEISTVSLWTRLKSLACWSRVADVLKLRDLPMLTQQAFLGSEEDISTSPVLNNIRNTQLFPLLSHVQLLARSPLLLPNLDIHKVLNTKTTYFLKHSPLHFIIRPLSLSLSVTLSLCLSVFLSFLFQPVFVLVDTRHGTQDMTAEYATRAIYAHTGAQPHQVCVCLLYHFIILIVRELTLHSAFFFFP
jgi:hypothetical protein